MSKVLVTKAKVDTIADKITALVDDTSKKTLDEMATSLNGVGLEVAEQEDLIAQIKSTVDSLPEAGGGPGTVAVETCSIFIQRDVPDGPGVSVYYLDESLQLQHITTTTTRIACVKNSIVVVSGAMMGEFSGDITQIGARAGFLIAAATGDGTIIYGV